MRPEERDARVSELLSQKRYDFTDLVDVMTILRMPGGCVWDAAQTHESIRDNMIEETYEVVEAIDNKDSALLREELGDALLQVVFHARIEEEAGGFNIDDVISDVTEKLVHRHPHVFGSIVASTPEAALQNWEAIKVEEKKRETLVSRLEAVPPQLPSLMRATKIAKKTEFWYGEKDLSAAGLAVEEALRALLSSDADSLEERIGELLYGVVVLSRKSSVSAEAALTKAVNRRIDEIRCAESLAENIPLETMTPEERAALRARLDALERNA